MKPFSEIVRWLLFPLALICLSLLLKFTGVDQGTSASDYSSDAMEQDAKLLRTLEGFKNDNRPGAGYPVVSLADRVGVRVDLKLDEEQVAHLARTEGWSQKRKGRKFHFGIAFDGGDTHPARFKVHGESSLEHDSARKSLSIELFDSRLWTGEFMLSSFFLIGLQFDPHQYEMLYSYRLLAEEGLFLCYHTPVAVYINGEPDGIYLIVEKPVDSIVRTFPDTISVYRRAGKSTLDPKLERGAPEAKLDLIRLVEATDNKNIEESGPVLMESLDLDQYYDLLAFNSLVCNGDPADEVFFYQHRPNNKIAQPFNVMAWDFDDVMEPPILERNPIDDPLLYAAITVLDKRIHQNPDFYARFVEVLRQRLESTWTPEHLKSTLEDVRHELNSIDTGEAPSVQAERIRDRNKAMDEFEEKLMARHAELLAIVDSDQL